MNIELAEKISEIAYTIREMQESIQEIKQNTKVFVSQKKFSEGILIPKTPEIEAALLDHYQNKLKEAEKELAKL